MFDTTHVLFRQTAGALHSIACDILVEDEATENHAERLKWARRVLADDQGPVVEADCWMWAMLTNYTLSLNPTTTADNVVREVAVELFPLMLKQHHHV